MSDIVIIGGGIAGLSAAAAIAPHASVTLLEAEPHLGYHASGRSAALYEAKYGSPTVRVLNEASRDYYMASGYLHPRGLMILGRAQDDAAFEADLLDMELDEISVEEAQALLPILNPDIVTRAAYHAEAWDIDTDRMLQDFAKIVRSHGGQIVTKAKVTGITRDGGWQLETTAGDFEATTLINAAGAWADETAQMAGVAPIGITPYRRSMARIDLPTGVDPAKWPMFFGVGETWYAKPDAGKLIVSPAEEDATTPHDAYADDMTLAEGLARYQELVTPEVTRMDSNWAGLRSFSPDRALVLGRDTAVPDFIWCAGQGGYGFQTAPAASNLVADITLGRTPSLDTDVVAALSPTRFC